MLKIQLSFRTTSLLNKAIDTAVEDSTTVAVEEEDLEEELAPDTPTSENATTAVILPISMPHVGKD
jgi:hypothetical protein